MQRGVEGEVAALRGEVSELKLLVVPEGGELPPEEELAAMEAAEAVEAAAVAPAPDAPDDEAAQVSTSVAWIDENCWPARRM